MKKSKIYTCFKRLYPYLCILGLAIMILYPQIQSKAYLSGYDSWFHMNQFYDTAMQFKTGHFSYFLSLFGFGGVGRIVNAVYGPGFVYLGGLILLIAKTWYRFEIIQDFIVLILGGFFFYLLVRKNHITRLIGTLLAMLYMMAPPIMSWVINQEFAGIGAVLIPLVLLQGTQMARNKKIRPLILGVIMAIVFQTHMLTTLVSALALIPFFICAWYQTGHRLRLWKNLALSIGLTIVLTGNVWGAMINVLPQGLIPPVPQGLPTSGGSLILMPDHYFSILGSIYSIIVIVFVICGGLSLLLWKSSDSLYKIILITGFFFIWLSSDYFPWRWALHIYPAFVYQIQYPKRFLCVGITLLFLAFGMLFNGRDVNILKVSSYQTLRIPMIIVQMILILFVGLGYVHQKSLFQHGFHLYRSNRVIDYNPFFAYRPNAKLAHQIRTSYHSPKLVKQGLTLVHQDSPDYLPTYKVSHTYGQYRNNGFYSGIEKQIYGSLKRFRGHRTVSNNQLTMIWNQKRAKHNVVLPVIKYKGTQIKLNHQLLRNSPSTRVGAATTHLIPKGKNELSINYLIPTWLKGLMWLTIISWLSVIIFAILSGINRFRARS